MTWLDLIRSSLRLIGELGPGRTITANSTPAVDAGFVLNAILDSANADRLNIFTISNASYNLTAGQQSYTIGASGNFNTTRPQKIESANLILSGNLRQPLKLINDQQFASIKLQSVQSTIPQYLYNDGNYPLSTLFLYPVPSANLQLELWTWQLLSQITDITATASLPPGYADFLRFRLAVRLAAEWGKPLRPDVVELANQAERNIQRGNLPAPLMACDGGVLNGRGGQFNYLTGEIG